MIFGRRKINWRVEKGAELTEMDKKVLDFQRRGYLCPRKDLILTPEQIEGIKKSGELNTALLDQVEATIREGMTTEEIDQIVYSFTTSHGGIPATLGYEGFPKSCCVSVNDVVCHGIPNTKEVLKAGDIVNVDVTTILNGYYADASRMFIIGGSTTPEKEALVRVAKECLDLGVELCKPYCLVGDFGHEIQKYAEKHGYSIVRELCGHGVGLKFHDDPEVCHYGKRGSGMLIVPGMVFTIEPMVNMGKKDITIDKYDKWTVRTADHKPSAQWEYTILMTEEGPEIITH